MWYHRQIVIAQHISNQIKRIKGTVEVMETIKQSKMEYRGNIMPNDGY